MRTKLERIRTDIEALAAFNATPGEGLTRLSFTEEHRKAAQYITEQMQQAGLAVRTDAVGTIIGRMEGTDPAAPVVMCGSHFDSVKNGGNFDGPAGVITGLETARVLHENGVVPKHPIEFIAMIEEEGARFGAGLFGSRAMTGRLGEQELATFTDPDGITTGQAMRAFGLDPAHYADAVRKKGEIKNFIELHIEQGPILENSGDAVGIVETVVGIKEVEVTVTGRPDHAGTTPMDMRADAFLVAAKTAIAANEAAVAAGEGTVATVGKLEVRPGSFNIVPGKVVFYVDIRSKSTGCIEAVLAAVTAKLNELTEGNGALSYALRMMVETKPVQADPHVCDLLAESAEKLGLTSRRMLSGAGHDAMIMADITNIGLVFVPSRGGRSHCPEEWTDYDLLQNGIETVCETVQRLACEG